RTGHPKGGRCVRRRWRGATRRGGGDGGGLPAAAGDGEKFPGIRVPEAGGAVFTRGGEVAAVEAEVEVGHRSWVDETGHTRVTAPLVPDVDEAVFAGGGHVQPVGGDRGGTQRPGVRVRRG